jgi:ionotropic glutamate receptor
VQAIIGPKTSMQARFIIGIGNMTNVPILSYSATSPYLSAKQSKYFIRTALDDASQVPAISSLIEYFSWRQVVLIYEDFEFVFFSRSRRRLARFCIERKRFGSIT